MINLLNLLMLAQSSDDDTLKLVGLVIVIVMFVPIIGLVFFQFIRIVRKNIKKNKMGFEQPKTVGLDYESYFGGPDNIENVEVIQSRVSISVKDLSLVKIEELQNLLKDALLVGNTIKSSDEALVEYYK